MLYIFDEVDSIEDGFLESVVALLSEERCAKMMRLRTPLKKKASAIAYLLLRLALSDVYGIEEVVEFDYIEKGKPVLRNYPHIHFNLSHSNSAVACVVSDVPVGVDVQHIAPISDKVARRVLTGDEYGKFKESRIPDEYFCEIWTTKESFLKKTGQGISVDLRDLSADSLVEKTIYRGRDYICCATGSNVKIKHVGRGDIERSY